jgi:conjugal transfer pilus assembly protein TraL
MDKEHQGYIPKTLDNPRRFMFWSFNQYIIFMMPFGFGVVTHFLFTGLATGIFLAWAFGRLSSGQARGFMIHLLYWFTPLGDSFKVIPPSSKRHFIG